MHKSFIMFIFVICISQILQGQIDMTFQKPSDAILKLSDYDRAPSVSLDSKREWMLLRYVDTYKSLADLNEEEMRLGGLRINPAVNITSQMNYVKNLVLKNTKSGVESQVKALPKDARIANISWSPDEKMVAFTHTTLTNVELWVIDILKCTASKVSSDLNANMGMPYQWKPDNSGFLIMKLPTNRAKLIDSKTILPLGPTISIGDGNVSQNRTYQDLLKNKTDETNFEILVESELMWLDMKGKSSPYLAKDMYSGVSFSPDGRFVLVSRIKKPFSYIVPLGRFPNDAVVYNLKGEALKVVNDVPLFEVSPKGFSSTRTGKRSMFWRSDKPASLYYVEALDGGDQAVSVPFRDELYSWDAPFDKAPKAIMKTINRYRYTEWGDDHHAMVHDSWYDSRNGKTYLVDPSDPTKSPTIIFDRNTQDIYSDPGQFESRKNQYNKYVVAIEDGKGYMIGDGFTADGQFPFIDEYNFITRSSKRVYTSKIEGKKEDIISIDDFKSGSCLVMIQSKNEFPNYFFRNFKTGDLKPITNFENPFASFSGVHKEVIKYQREDGVALSGTLYLPTGYDRSAKSEKLPLLIWAYPEEFKDKNSAGQVSKNENEFSFPYYGSFIYYVMNGYAVLDDASFPIIGEGKTEPNDNFISQLVANAKSAIDAVDALGYIDRKKVGVGGHSYGAFMTANLLTHSNLFACGIARSGAYNRTLTPFGFQSEQRNYWDVPEIYNGMSPFMSAAKMKTPLLLVHGDADNNPGTFTLQSERYFQALKGLGAPVRLVLLPKEAHGYRAKENILHLLWEQEQFLNKYLK